MRLSVDDIRRIIAALAPFTLEVPCSVYLFGSRVDNAKHGGDIDLLLVADTQDQAFQLRKQKLDISVSMTKQLGDRRVDLIIAKPDDLKTDPFLATIWPTAVMLHRWEAASH
jgi:predicted nucleotidyltransferase